MSEKMEMKLRSSGEAKSLLRQYLEAIDIEIVKDLQEDDFWGFWVNFGNFPILIQHPPKMHYCVVSFQITIPDEESVKKLNEKYARNDTKFMFELTRAFTSPFTAFTRIVEEGQVIGYTVSKLIYPYHPEFSMRTLDIAIQAVVSTGAVGAAFLRMALGHQYLTHEITEKMAYSAPGPMFS